MWARSGLCAFDASTSDHAGREPGLDQPICRASLSGGRERGARNPAHHLEGAAALGDSQGQSDPLHDAITRRPRARPSRRPASRADRARADRQLPLHEAPPLGRSRCRRSSPSIRCWSRRQARHWPERGERQLRWFAPEEAAEAVEEPELKVIILSFNGRKEAFYPRSSLVVMGVNRFSWGYRMLKLIRKIMPREDRFFDMFERHAHIIVAGADAMEKMVAGDERDRRPPARTIADSRECRRRRHPRRAGRGAPLLHHAVRPQRDHRAHLGDGQCDRRDVADRQGDHPLRGRPASSRRWRRWAGSAARPRRLVLEAIPLMRNIGRNAGRLHEITEPIVHLEGKADELHDAGLRALIAGGAKKDPMALHRRPRGLPPSRAGARRASRTSPTRSQGIVIDHA